MLHQVPKGNFLVKTELVESDQHNMRNFPWDTISDIKPRQDFHCTILFAEQWQTEPSEDLVQTFPSEGTYKIKGVDQFGTAIVLLLDVPQDDIFLRGSNKQLKQNMTAVDQHPVYNPHVTIGYKLDNSVGENRMLNRTLDTLSKYFVGRLLSFSGIKMKILPST